MTKGYVARLDPKARNEYLTGFSKRKQERKSFAQRKKLEQEKLERREADKEVVKDTKRQIKQVKRFQLKNEYVEMRRINKVGDQPATEEVISESEDEEPIPQPDREYSGEFYGSANSRIVLRVCDGLPKDPVTLRIEKKIKSKKP